MAEEIIAQALRLNDMIDYQKDSVVSRTFVKKEAGTVTLFAFDENQALSEHTTPYDAMAYILDGEAEITVDGKVFSLEAGEMIIMPANKPHALRATERYKMLLIMVKS